MSWPPPPHDPREREVLLHVAGWELRAFARDDVKHRYFAPRGMLHVQLWHPAAGVSVLTRSRLTADRYEAFPIEGWKFPHGELAVVRHAVAAEHGVAMPGDAVIRALERWFVAREQRAAAGLPPLPTPDTIQEAES